MPRRRRGGRPDSRALSIVLAAHSSVSSRLLGPHRDFIAAAVYVVARWQSSARNRVRRQPRRGALVNRLIGGLASGEVSTFRALRRRYLRGVEAIEDAGYYEVFDSAVIDEIFDALYVPCARKGYSAEAVVSG